MLATAQTCAVVGLDGYIVRVEVDISPGLPKFNIVGLPDPAVQEARERVRAALRNSGFEFPMRRITANLAPADLKKAGPGYDLPIAVSILLSSGQLSGISEDGVFLGELSLDGTLRHTTGILTMVSIARQQGFTSVFVPEVDAPEAALVDGVDVYPVSSLGSLTGHLRGDLAISPLDSTGVQASASCNSAVDSNLANVKGQEHAKRALEVAAAGFHNLLFNGPPGSGKTLLARCLPSILPRMSPEEALEVTKIYSVSGELPAGEPMITKRPFRSPHYTISNAGLVGGGRLLRPGEITKSHRGVLFLDELPEFSHTALESLRQPLEDKVVNISRVAGTVTYPASFMLVAAMNPCPCGYHTHPKRQCTCTASVVNRYQKRISGPLLDRIDVFAEVPPVEYEKLVDPGSSEDSEYSRQRVERARDIQQERFKNLGFRCNSEMGPAEVWKCCPLDDGARSLLQAATQRLSLSARAFHRILKVSRTIADLDGAKDIGVSHLAEALQYRPRTSAA